MAFDDLSDVQVERDEEGRARVVRHRGDPFTSERAGLTSPTPRELADEYVRQVAGLYGVDPEQAADLSGTLRDEPGDQGTALRFGTEKTVMDTTVVAYQQTAVGLPVWQSALEVRVYGDPPRVASSDSTLHHDLEVSVPPAQSLTDLTDADAVRAVLGIADASDGAFTLNGTRLLVYRYEPEERIDPTAGTEGFAGGPPVLPLPPVPPSIEPHRHYVVREVLFTFSLPGWTDLNWRAFIEPETQAVLYLRALVASATCSVFMTDPVSASGTALTGCSPAAQLDPLRKTTELLGLDPPDGSGRQSLRGRYVALVDTDAPAVAPPTATAPFDFTASATTDNFAAASAYVHYDGVYRLMEGMGFDVPAYFDGTSFPVPVDHQGFGTQVNASANGNGAGNGMGKYRNGLAAVGCTVGIAADVRVVLHEFGHALLWDHVGSPNFGWCHSAGDTMAAVLHDPESKAQNRFETFPFIPIGRSHNRDVTQGWAWGGTRDDTQYGSEQILSTTLFRVYRSAGGDDPDLAVRKAASRYLVFLVLKAIGTLTVTTRNPAVYVAALMDADDSTLDFEGQPGGAWHKVIRWSFEQQGLFQPGGTPRPVAGPGAPPPVDVFIDDGRAGAYMPFLPDPFVGGDLWNRHAPDAGTTHQPPASGATNHVYVRVRNRGTQAAGGVTVRLYRGDRAGDLTWPTGWTPATTQEIGVPGTIPPGGQTVVGPFAWDPAGGDECLLASVSAPGDLSNADTVNGPVPVERLARLDNNVALRAVGSGPDSSTGRVAAGQTQPGAGWQVYTGGGAGIYLDVDTSSGQFTRTPVYVTSLGGTSSHWAVTGGSAVYLPTPTGFRVYLRYPDGRAITPAAAIANGWYVSWVGVE